MTCYGFICSFRFLQAPICLIAPLKNALISNAIPLLRRDMLCRGVNVWKKNLLWLDYLGTLPTAIEHYRFRCNDNISDGVGILMTIKTCRPKTKAFHASSHASHQYAPRSRWWTNSKIKEWTIWTSTECLSGSYMSSFDRMKILLHAILASTNRGVR